MTLLAVPTFKRETPMGILCPIKVQDHAKWSILNQSEASRRAFAPFILFQQWGNASRLVPLSVVADFGSVKMSGVPALMQFVILAHHC